MRTLFEYIPLWPLVGGVLGAIASVILAFLAAFIIHGIWIGMLLGSTVTVAGIVLGAWAEKKVKRNNE